MEGKYAGLDVGPTNMSHSETSIQLEMFSVDLAPSCLPSQLFNAAPQ